MSWKDIWDAGYLGSNRAIEISTGSAGQYGYWIDFTFGLAGRIFTNRERILVVFMSTEGAFRLRSAERTDTYANWDGATATGIAPIAANTYWPLHINVDSPYAILTPNAKPSAVASQFVNMFCTSDIIPLTALSVTITAFTS